MTTRGHLRAVEDVGSMKFKKKYCVKCAGWQQFLHSLGCLGCRKSKRETPGLKIDKKEFLKP